jgi:hypothetical protein
LNKIKKNYKLEQISKIGINFKIGTNFKNGTNYELKQISKMEEITN